MTHGLLRIGTTVLAGVALAGAVVRTQSASAPELKAAYVINFVKFTDWPADALSASAPLMVCVNDADVAAALESATAAGPIGTHPVVIRRVKPDDILPACGVLYLSKIDQPRTARVLAMLHRSPVLSIGDMAAFAESGGVVGLFVDGGRIRFAVNTDAVERARLHMSSKLLSLARIVKD